MRQFIQRREFLKTALAGVAMGSSLFSCQKKVTGGVPKRPLGTTGELVSIIGIGGWDIGAVENYKDAIAIMHEAIDNGVNFFDNCWDYHAGGSEKVMGQALIEPNRRDKVFLMTKVCARDYADAKKQLEDSLRRLRTDRIDLWQFHGIQWDDDDQLIFDPENGAMRAALEARLEGKIRYIGFTGHKDPNFHLKMLEHDFAWNTIQMPMNLLDAHYRSFQQMVAPQVVQRKIGLIGMKGLAAQNGLLVREFGLSAEQARRYALSLPVATLVCGIQSRENLLQDMNIARQFKPMSENEIRKLVDKVADRAADGKLEAYKVGNYGCDWHHKSHKL